MHEAQADARRKRSARRDCICNPLFSVAFAVLWSVADETLFVRKVPREDAMQHRRILELHAFVASLATLSQESGRACCD
jgi:hypothetical protein